MTNLSCSSISIPTLSATRPLVLVAAAVLIDQEGCVLLAQRPADKSFAGLWEFPGGKVKEGELPELALKRELYEELGIDIAPGCLSPLTFASHAYADFHLLMPLFACRQWQGTPQGREGQNLVWAPKQEWRHYAMPPADEHIIPLLFELI